MGDKVEGQLQVVVLIILYVRLYVREPMMSDLDELNELLGLQDYITNQINITQKIVLRLGIKHPSRCGH